MINSLTARFMGGNGTVISATDYDKTGYYVGLGLAISSSIFIGMYV
jgi:hypothetical protein